MRCLSASLMPCANTSNGNSKSSRLLVLNEKFNFITTLLKSIGKHPNYPDNIQRHLTCFALTELDAQPCGNNPERHIQKRSLQSIRSAPMQIWITLQLWARYVFLMNSQATSRKIEIRVVRRTSRVNRASLIDGN